MISKRALNPRSDCYQCPRSSCHGCHMKVNKRLQNKRGIDKVLTPSENVSLSQSLPIPPIGMQRAYGVVTPQTMANWLNEETP